MYVTDDLNKKTLDHTTIAVAPVEITLKGNIPEDMSNEYVEFAEISESEAFQLSLHSSVLRSTRRGKKLMDVKMLSGRQTNSILAELGISIQYSWQMSPRKLANGLGEDAEVTCTIIKERYLSDAASFAIGDGMSILGEMEGVHMCLLTDLVKLMIFT